MIKATLSINGRPAFLHFSDDESACASYSRALARAIASGDRISMQVGPVPPGDVLVRLSWAQGLATHMAQAEEYDITVKLGNVPVYEGVKPAGARPAAYIERVLFGVRVCAFAAETVTYTIRLKESDFLKEITLVRTIGELANEVYVKEAI